MILGSLDPYLSASTPGYRVRVLAELTLLCPTDAAPRAAVDQVQHLLATALPDNVQFELSPVVEVEPFPG